MVEPIRVGAVVIALCAHWAPTSAQNVYRCGDSYGNQPCAGATMVVAEDPRSAAQRAATEAASRRDAKSAAVMEKERVKLEAEPAQATIPPTRIEAAEPVAERLAAGRNSRLRKPELFTAVVPRKAGDTGSKTATKKSKGRKPAKTGAA